MHITSPEQYEAFTQGVLPGVEQIRDGMWALPLPLPSKFPGGAIPYSYAYVIDDFSDGLHVIDPGWDLPGNVERWSNFFTTIGREFADVATITATHLHHDHLGLATELSERSGATVVMHMVEAQAIAHASEQTQRSYAYIDEERLEGWGVPGDRWPELLSSLLPLTYPRPETVIKDGDQLPIPGRNLFAIWTPGHTGGHICIRDEDTRVLFTADHVLPGIYSGIGLGGPSPHNPVADMVASLKIIEEYDDYEAAPGHEYRFRGIADRARDIAAHHRTRTDEVRESMNERTTVWEIATKVTWSDGFDALTSYRLGSALSQVAMHADYARCTGS